MRNVFKGVKGKLFMVLLLVLIAACSLVVLSGCTAKERQKFFEAYGMDNAYNHTTSGVVRHAPKSISYYIDPSVTGNYRTAVEDAIKKANALTGKVTMTYNTNNAKSSYVIKVENVGSTGWSGLNSSYANPTTGEITQSTITLNSYYLKSYSANMLKEVILHEIGHTFGLRDLNETSDLVKYSVMYYQADYTYVYTQYQDFDKANIEWYYD